MDLNQIKSLVSQLDSSRVAERETAWSQLRPLGGSVVEHLAEFYPKARKAEGRSSIVYHAMGYARTSETAFQLGLAALSDRASFVRYRACGLLAYSLRDEAIPHLKKLLLHKDAKTVNDARAAIDAVQNHNHNYFVDRNHSGRSFWVVNKEDKPLGT